MSDKKRDKASPERHECSELLAVRAVLAEREKELLELKGPCSGGCRLHYAHNGPCDFREGRAWPAMNAQLMPLGHVQDGFKIVDNGNGHEWAEIGNPTEGKYSAVTSRGESVNYKGRGA